MDYILCHAVCDNDYADIPFVIKYYEVSDTEVRSECKIINVVVLVN